MKCMFCFKEIGSSGKCNCEASHSFNTFMGNTFVPEVKSDNCQGCGEPLELSEDFQTQLNEALESMKNYAPPYDYKCGCCGSEFNKYGYKDGKCLCPFCGIPLEGLSL